MPCEVADLTAIHCNDQSLNSPTVQRKIWRQFLCLILDNLVPATVCTEAALLAASEDLLCQGSPAKLRLTQVQTMCDLLAIDCNPTECLTPMQEEAIITYLVCEIADAIET